MGESLGSRMGLGRKFFHKEACFLKLTGESWLWIRGPEGDATFWS
jgi:hypothetical protein